MKFSKFKNSILLLLLCTMLFSLSACNTVKDVQVSNNSDEDKKVLTMAIASETTLLSPLYMGTMNLCTDKLVYENLVNYEDGKIVPGLAEKWKFSEDGKELTFFIRKNVKLHNGEDFNAEVVKKNLEHKMSNPSFYTLKAITEIESMDVVDKNTITIHYPRPYFAYLSDFCWPDVMTFVAPELLIEGDFQTVSGVIGTGPYKYDEIIPGQYTRFIRNEEYWGDKPYYDEVIVKYIPDSSSRIQALKTGEIDMIYGSVLLSYEDYKQAIDLPNISGQIAEKNTRARDITLNVSNPILSDINVRKAIVYAIDKEEISQGLSYGYEEIAKIPFTVDSPYSDVKLNSDFKYDPEKSKKLLDKAGWKLKGDSVVREKDGKSLTLTFTLDAAYDSLNTSLATLLKNQLAEVGIDLNIVSQEYMEWYYEYMKGNFDLTLWQGQYAYANPHCWFNPMDTMTPQTSSLQGMDDSRIFFDKIKETTGLNDEKKLNDIFTYLINYNLDNVIDIPLTYQKDMIIYNNSKIEEYNFKGVPSFFDILELKNK